MNSWRPGVIVLCVLPCIAFLLHTNHVCAQEWISRLSFPAVTFDEVAAMKTDTEHAFIAGSCINARGDWDAVLAAFNSDGDTLWTKHWDLGADEKAVALSLDDQGGLLLAITQWHNAGSTAYLARWTLSGSPHWHRGFGDGAPRSNAIGLTPLATGKVAFLYSSEGDAVSRCGIAVLTINGALLWSELLPEAHPGAITSDGNEIAIVSTEVLHPSRCTFHLYDDTGIQLSTDHFTAPGNGVNVPKYVRNGSDGYLVAGTVIDEQGHGIPYVLHYTSAGKRDWSALPMSRTGKHRLMNLAAFPGGGAVITVREEAHGGDADIYIARLDSDGNSVWAQSFDRSGAGFDQHPPLFAGISGATWRGNNADLCWPPAHDEISTADELRYRVYLATTSAGHDFNAPADEVLGKHSCSLTGLTPGDRAYVVVRAVDAAGNEDSNTRELIIDVPSPQLHITSPRLLEIDPCTPFLHQLEASGGLPPYAWSILSGVLPAGFTFQQSGRIEGSTAATGNYSVHLQCSDAAGDTVSAEIVFRVLPPPRLIVEHDMTLEAGAHCFSTLIVNAGSILSFNGAVSLLIQDSLIVDGVIRSECADIVCTSFSHVLIRGSIDNRCPDPETGQPGNLSFISGHGSLELRDMRPGGGLFT
ncbi:MAG: hypothetical protein KFH87_00340, partial [Bacteroidetes bacterium]|nr:hypothetical protein [Bacteroidota bacterium]